MKTNWSLLAKKLNCEHQGSSNLARLALAEMIGEEEILAAVDHYVDGREGGELARSVLWLLRPQAARLRCMEIYQHDPELERRRAAIELLRVVATRETLHWIPTFLSDPDAGIQLWGAGVLDQLLWSDLVAPEACQSILATMKDHASAAVREKHQFIAEYLQARSAKETA